MLGNLGAYSICLTVFQCLLSNVILKLKYLTQPLVSEVWFTAFNMDLTAFFIFQ